MDLLHDIPAGDPKSLVNVIIEIPGGSGVKYEYQPDKKIIVADRFLHTAMSYPFNYGFIPRTWSEDHDALDIVVISSHSVATGVLLEARVIGMLEMEDEEGKDAKLVAVPKAKVDPVYAHIESVDDLTKHERDKIQHFFEHYKELESHKWVKVTGWASKEGAQQAVLECMQRYTEQFPKNEDVA